MTPAETRAVLTVSILAAYADGAKHDRERDEIRRIAQGLSQDEAVAMPTLVQDVLMQRVSLDSVLPALASEASRHLAYEMAVGVCDADGAQSAAEQAFLAQLRQGLKLELLSADSFGQQAEALAAASAYPPVPAASNTGSGIADGLASISRAGLPAASATPASGAAASIDVATQQKAILDAAILNGALELLPESLSTMAIIPLQMKLVYRIGLSYGYPLDSGHIKDFIATAGVGLTSQYLEQAGRKLLGGLLGRLGGGLVGGIGRQAVSSGMSFVSTYALGQLAVRYYGSGRTMSAQVLKDTYGQIAEQARALVDQHMPAMQAQARTLNPARVLSMVRG